VFNRCSEFSDAVIICFSVSNALAAERRTRQYNDSHPVEAAPEDPTDVSADRLTAPEL